MSKRAGIEIATGEDEAAPMCLGLVPECGELT